MGLRTWQPTLILVSSHDPRGGLTINYDNYYYSLIQLPNHEHCTRHRHYKNLIQKELTRYYLATRSAKSITSQLECCSVMDSQSGSIGRYTGVR